MGKKVISHEADGSGNKESKNAPHGFWGGNTIFQYGGILCSMQLKGNTITWLW